MAQTTVTRTIDRDAGAVWALLADFGDIGWIPMAENVEVVGEGVGMRRLIPAGDGDPIAEALVDIDHDGRVLTYSIENPPFPVSSYLAVCTVTDTADGAAVEWVVTFEPTGEEADAAGAIAAIYDMMAGWLADATA